MFILIGRAQVKIDSVYTMRFHGQANVACILPAVKMGLTRPPGRTSLPVCERTAV